MVQMSIVSSDTQVNISKVKYFKIRKQVLSFQYTRVQNTPSYSSRQECTLLFQPHAMPARRQTRLSIKFITPFIPHAIYTAVLNTVQMPATAYTLP